MSNGNTLKTGKRWPMLLASLALLTVAIFIYFNNLSHNPPGFFIDESSIAYNAHTIAQTGHDEHGIAWPLFFRAFGEFKNPVYIYLLAGLFRITGPGIPAARCLSATIGLVTAALLGLLADRISERRSVGFFVGLTALFTPWLFELSRVVIEVTLYPLMLTLFLLSVWRSSKRPSWNWTDVAGLTICLALLTYTYSIGRLLAPLFAVGLISFMTRARIRWLLLTWAVYALTLVPMLIFQARNPQALTSRFALLTYLAPQSRPLHVGREFLTHFAANLDPWKIFVSENSKTNELLHISGAPAMLTVGVILICASIILIFRRKQLTAWWVFVFYGLAVSILPASLTKEYFHMLRLSPISVFLIVLTIPALMWLIEPPGRAKAVAAFVTMLCVLGQGLYFQWQYQASAHSPQRLHTFDADYPARIFPAALASAKSAPIYLADNPARPGYIQAYWYATLQKIPLSKFISLGLDKPAPEGAVVITTESSCPRCCIVAESEPYTTYIAQGQPREPKPLSDDAFKAETMIKNPPLALRTGEQATIQVTVKNASKSAWLASERTGSPYQLQLRNHWLDANGNMLIHDDGRGALPADLKPGETTTIPLTINAPQRAGHYTLEIDMLQEGVSWFGPKGSPTVRLPVKIE